MLVLQEKKEDDSTSKYVTEVYDIALTSVSYVIFMNKEFVFEIVGFVLNSCKIITPSGFDVYKERLHITSKIF
jgi:hypothetical protein